jgi:hypothetical protein
MLEMLELRTSVESDAAGPAATRRTDEHLREMRSALDDFEPAPRKSRHDGCARPSGQQPRAPAAGACGPVVDGCGGFTVSRAHSDEAPLAVARM